jgi:hypothetical protein
VITFRGEGYHLRIRSFDETNGGDPLEFNGLHHVGIDPNYMVHPCKSGVVSGDYFVDPIPCLKAVNVGCRIPWDTHYDDFSIVLIGGVVGHLEGAKAFPCPARWVPKIFDSSAAKIGNGASFTETTYSQGETNRVEYERVAENGLFENLRMGCKFRLCLINFYVKPKAKDALLE